MNKTYQVKDLMVNLIIEGDKINGTYFKSNKEDVKGAIELSKIGDVFKGTFTDFNGDKGTMILDSIDDNSFEIRWGAGIDNKNPKGKWSGKKLKNENDGQYTYGLDVAKLNDIDFSDLSIIKQILIVKVNEQVIECSDVFEGITGSVNILHNVWEDKFLIQFVQNEGYTSSILFSDDIDEINDEVEKYIKNELNIETWEASGLLDFIESDSFDTLEDEELEYSIIDTSDFEFDMEEEGINVGMKGLGMNFSNEVNAKFLNGAILVDECEIHLLSEITGYTSSETKQFIVIN